MASTDSFGAKGTIQAGGAEHEIFRLSAVEGAERLPFSLKVLLENLLRTEDGANVTADHIRALAGWDPTAEPDTEIQFTPARVIMQDFTGVPCVVDLATMREAVTELGGDPAKVNPLAPAELVIDHSVIIDVFGSPDAFERNVDFEYSRNKERYQFLRWGQGAFDEFKVVPPGTGIVHQVNIEHLARVVMTRNGQAYPDTLVGTDSHTTMVNGLGVLGWGVGGIEAEAAMLGQPVSMLIPKVVGFKLTGEIPPGATATDVVLTITEMLRRQGVVGKFVEFYGEGVGAVPLANRATIGNMSPEFGSTAAIFPIDDETVRYLKLTGRPAAQIELVEAYAKEQGLWHDPAREPVFSETLELDLSTVVPSIAGPKRPQDRIELSSAKQAFRSVLVDYAGTPDADGPGRRRSTRHPSVDESVEETFPASDPAAPGGQSEDEAPHQSVFSAAEGADGRASRPVTVTLADGASFELDHGAVVISSITSCTNTSNPSVMLGAALLAKNAVDRGLAIKPWVKTSMAPGSKVVTDYYERAGLWPYLEKLGYHLVGYGCTTCIGNSGPLAEEISAGVNEGDLAVVSVLSGNRNFEGRINPDIKMNYLASPPLVIAYGLAGTMDFDFETQPLGTAPDGSEVYLRDIWPTAQDVQATIDSSITEEMFTKDYADVFAGDERWRSLPTPEGKTFAWDPESTYVRKPPYFDGHGAGPVAGHRRLRRAGAGQARRLGDHGPHLPRRLDQGRHPGRAVPRRARRGEARLQLLRVAARQPRGDDPRHVREHPAAQPAAGRRRAAGTPATSPRTARRRRSSTTPRRTTPTAGIPLVVLGGKEYGSGSSRDWAAKGTALLGVKAVIVESYERIHRSNLIGMGVLPLQFPAGETAESLGLDGTETFDISGVTALNDGTTPRTVHVTATEGRTRREGRVRRGGPHRHPR